MLIETPNLKIRPFQAEDFEAVYKYMSDTQVTYYLPEGTMTKSDVASFIADNQKAFAICNKNNGKLMGHIEFYAWFGDHTYEIGWAINPEFHRCGVAYEAAFAVLKYGFQRLGIHRVIATAQPENTASYRLMEKLGMVREGHFRQCIPKGSGVWWDEYFYSMLAEDFKRPLVQER